MGSEKASVLPVPVRARPITSRPSMAGLSTAAWMGKSFSMPRALSAASVLELSLNAGDEICARPKIQPSQRQSSAHR
jgi:hypothetical protein